MIRAVSWSPRALARSACWRSSSAGVRGSGTGILSDHGADEFPAATVGGHGDAVPPRAESAHDEQAPAALAVDAGAGGSRWNGYGIPYDDKDAGVIGRESEPDGSVEPCGLCRLNRIRDDLGSDVLGLFGELVQPPFTEDEPV